MSGDFEIAIDYGALPQVLMKEVNNPRLIRDASIGAIDFVQPLVQRVLWENTPVGTGLARTLIQYERPNKGQWNPVGRVGYASPASEYMFFVDVGTTAHWAPLSPLLLWGARKFGEPLIGWYVRFGIARHGTKPQHFLNRVQEQLRAPVSQMMVDYITKYLNSPWGRIRSRVGF